MIKTLSIPDKLEEFLKENPDLSPSKMLQAKIIEIKENRSFRFAEIAKLQKHILFLNDKLASAGSQIVLLEKKLNPKSNPDDGKNKKLKDVF